MRTPIGYAEDDRDDGSRWFDADDREPSTVRVIPHRNVNRIAGNGIGRRIA